MLFGYGHRVDLEGKDGGGRGEPWFCRGGRCHWVYDVCEEGWKDEGVRVFFNGLGRVWTSGVWLGV